MNNKFFSKTIVYAIFLCVGWLFSGCSAQMRVDKSCAVLVSSAVRGDDDWNKAALQVQKRRKASLFYFNSHPEECEAQLREKKPRYVIIVEKPENIDADYVMQVNKFSRRIDNDVYADFLWGILTGHDAASLSRMAENSVKPLVIHNCVSDVTELQSAKWFDNYAWVDDQKKGLAGEKHGLTSTVKTHNFNFDDELKILAQYLYDYNPDLIVTSTHANYNLLTVPFMPSNQSKFVSDSGYIWKEYNGKKTEKVKFTGKRNVYFPVGNCLIAGMNKNPNSMPVAWINHANSTAMAGYVVTTWYGRNGWGGLKYWLTTPGRYTLPEAIYLNQQDMLAQMNAWDPGFSRIDYPFHPTEAEKNANPKLTDFGMADKRIREATSLDSVSMDYIGFLHDRDVLAYYGDPLWDVRLQTLEKEKDFKVDFRQKKGEVVLVITTNKEFSLTRLKGDHFKEEHVLDLPFSYFFPCRLKNPRLANSEKWQAVLDENFLLINEPAFEPGKTYEVHILTDGIFENK